MAAHDTTARLKGRRCVGTTGKGTHCRNSAERGWLTCGEHHGAENGELKVYVDHERVAAAFASEANG